MSVLLLSVSSLALTSTAQSRRFLRGAHSAAAVVVAVACAVVVVGFFGGDLSAALQEAHDARVHLAFAVRRHRFGSTSAPKNKKHTQTRHESESQKAPETPTTTTTTSNDGACQRLRLLSNSCELVNFRFRVAIQKDVEQTNSKLE